jgi:hypothetical protein
MNCPYRMGRVAGPPARLSAPFRVGPSAEMMADRSASGGRPGRHRCRAGLSGFAETEGRPSDEPRSSRQTDNARPPDIAQ